MGCDLLLLLAALPLGLSDRINCIQCTLWPVVRNWQQSVTESAAQKTSATWTDVLLLGNKTNLRNLHEVKPGHLTDGDVPGDAEQLRVDDARADEVLEEEVGAEGPGVALRNQTWQRKLRFRCFTSLHFTSRAATKRASDVARRSIVKNFKREKQLSSLNVFAAAGETRTRRNNGFQPGGSWADILCTQMHYICFILVLDAGCWVRMGCYNGSLYKKRLKTTTLKYSTVIQK